MLAFARRRIRLARPGYVSSKRREHGLGLGLGTTGTLHGAIQWAGALALIVRPDEPSLAAAATTALTACETAVRRPARAIEVLPTVDFERRRVTGEMRLPEPPPHMQPPPAPPTWGA